MPNKTKADSYRLYASASLIALIALCLSWELFLAPLRPGGSWLVLKALPLLIPLFGILRGKRYTYQWACMFVLIYFAEGATRGWSDKGISQLLALAEVAISILFFWSTIAYVRATAPSRLVANDPSAPTNPRNDS